MVGFIESPTELTTAATDLLLTVECAGLLLIFRRKTVIDTFYRGIWSWVLILLGGAALIAAVAHGLDLSETVREWLWKPMYLSLGILVALFLVGALHIWRGSVVSRRALPWALGLGILLFGITELLHGLFIVFTLYQAVVMVSALIIFSVVAANRRQRSARIMVAAIVVNLIAAGIQASSLTCTCIWQFDHNGLFHCVQIVAVALMGWALLDKPSLLKQG